jgi:glucokinase
MVTRSPNVPGVLYQDLSGALEEATGIRTKVDNDANCVAVAAYVEGPRSIDPDPSDESGAGVRARPQGDQVVLAVTLGTGIGGGLVVDGTVLRGGDGYALEPGHMVVEPGGIQCRCGQQGCWERYASGTAIVGLATDAIEQGWTPERAKGSDALPGAAISSERIVELARSGDEVAMGITRQVGKWLAFGVQNLVGLLNPTWVVLGGGLAGEADLFLPAVHASVAGNPQLAGHGVSITVAPHGPAAGAVGAGIIAASA